MNAEISALLDRVQKMANDFIILLPNIVLGLFVFTIFVIFGRSIKRLVKRLTRHRTYARNLGMVLGRLAQGTTVLVGLFISLTIVFPSLKASDLVQLLGISGVAIGFAFRDILQNFLAGILILLTEPFQINDQIVFKNFEGTVENIETRATTIRTYDGRRIVIPNSELFTNSVTVNTAFENRRLEYDVGVGYGDDLDWTKQLMLEAMHSLDVVLKDPPPDVLVMELAENSVNIRARWWIQPPRWSDALDSRDQVISAIKQKLYVENGIDLPYPTRQILFHDQTEETDGDRTRQREGWPSGKNKVPKPRSIGGSLQRLAQLQDRNGKVDAHERNHES
ncbi:mechanosensitive ion channel family protein [Nodularia spumigena]|jgi:small conductance mechanosensitive channel|uniref:Small-conductance mechanosensitive channel n=2 Tax=Nodularia spumigena TaxID=70799 RepID=A0A2S0Q9V6_NODSP|nr:mechanosensitive ion channel family protein [Nodularia spumigena]AVZ31142.1 small-conductance mechanosensitive channel [Nodularia spumigena UHCC 0039]MEA5527583.1 mechanosensitive ion channel family protein [Nodularia spumigena UHCC 0143]MEA5554994.1 mechanosensitive ion channel family protein [Nodularia spumigena CH309]MEA5610516.1 mechanosensitive ion channel family protein [Nodularia spumigena UHCC 0060]MEA5613646.1 mechanosensitive ion channel family protein [Nodularia spumigena UHCC 00